MVWGALILAGLIACVASGVVAARHAALGPGGYALLIGIAVLVGIANGWATHEVGEIFVRRTKDHSEEIRERYARLLYLAACVWCFVPPYLIISAARHLLAPAQ